MLAVIGGSGLTQLGNLEVTRREVVRTPFGEPSGALTFGRIGCQEVVFLARHGYGHTIPPHRVNYRANLWALARMAGAEGIISVASVGGVRTDLGPGTLVVPDQIIDYTWGRNVTFHEGNGNQVVHIDFTEPYDRGLRQQLLAAAQRAGEAMLDGADSPIELFHGYTYSGHPLAAAAGLATLDIYRDEGLFERASALSAYWEDALHSLLGKPHVIDLRNMGLVAGIELEPRPGAPTMRATELFHACFDNGLLVRATGDIIALSPPLILETAHIDEMFGKIGDLLGTIA